MGRIFEISSKDAVHQFSETVKAIADYVGQEYTHGGDIRYQEYFERIRNIVDVIKSLGGSLCDDMHMKEELPDQDRPRGGYTEQQRREARERIQNKKIAYGILVRADRTRYGKLIEEVENDFLKGHDNYPKTPTEAYNLLVNYRNYVTVNKRNVQQGGLDQVAFVTDGKRQKTDGEENKFPHIKCFKCSKSGHYKSDCPKRNQGNTSSDNAQESPQITLVTQHVTLAVTRLMIDPMWILCDNESTVDVFNNKEFLTNISRAKNPIQLKGIDGNSIDVEEEGELLGYGKAYYHPHVTANVLSFFNKSKHFKSVIYNNQEQDAFLVMRDDGSIFEFTPSKEGLYYYDFRNSIARSTMPAVQSTMVVESVEELKRNFTARELK
jgi:hypothetical protein